MYFIVEEFVLLLYFLDNFLFSTCYLIPAFHFCSVEEVVGFGLGLILFVDMRSLDDPIKNGLLLKPCPPGSN